MVANLTSEVLMISYLHHFAIQSTTIGPGSERISVSYRHDAMQEAARYRHAQGSLFPTTKFSKLQGAQKVGTCTMAGKIPCSLYLHAW